MAWIQIEDGVLINLDFAKSIERKGKLNSRVIMDGEKMTAEIPYDALKRIVGISGSPEQIHRGG